MPKPKNKQGNNTGYLQTLLNKHEILNTVEIVDPNSPALYISPPVPEVIEERKDEESEEEEVRYHFNQLDEDFFNNSSDEEAETSSDEFFEEEYLNDEDLELLNADAQPDELLLAYENGESLLRKRKRGQDNEEEDEQTQVIKRIPVEHQPSISIITWNIEKFGKTTHALIAEKKSKALVRILDELQPMIMVMQEVSNARLFLDGDENNTGVRDTDILEMYKENILFQAHFIDGMKNLQNKIKYKNTLEILDDLEKSNDSLIDTVSDILRIIDEIRSDIEKDPDPSTSDIKLLLLKWLKSNEAIIKHKYNDWLDPSKRIKLKIEKIEKRKNKKKENTSEIETLKKQLVQKEITKRKREIKGKLIEELQEFGREAEEIFHTIGEDPNILIDIDNTEEALESKSLVDRVKSVLAAYTSRFNLIPDIENNKPVHDIYQEYDLLSYKLSKEYKMLEGPQFIADVDLSMMSDYYPVFYNTSNIPDDPDLYTYDLKTHDLVALDYKKYHYSFRYGTVTNEQIKTTLDNKEKKLKELENKNELSEEEKAEILILREFIARLKKNELEMKRTRHLKTREVAIEYATKENGAFKTNRQLVLWKFRVPVKRYSFRVPDLSSHLFASSDKLGRLEKYAEYTEIFIGVVHTSPSLNIKGEINAIIDGAKQLSIKTGIPVLLGGDWYMEKKMPDEFEKLQKGTFADWTLIAPSNNTNLPGIGKGGQIADHFLGQEGKFTNVATRSLPPPMYVEGISGTEPGKSWLGGYNRKRLDAWNNMVVDHTPVHSIVNIHLDTTNKKTVINMLKTSLNGSYTCPATFNNFTVKQVYITTGLQVSYIKEGGISLNSYTGNGKSIENVNKINQLLMGINTYDPLKLNTSQLNDGQMLTNIPDPKWSYVKAILHENGQLTHNAGKGVAGHSSILTQQRSCIFTCGITQGFGLIVAANTNEQWYASVANCKGVPPTTDQLSELFAWENGPQPNAFSALIVINRMHITTKEQADQLIADLLNILLPTGISSENISVYQSYSIGQSPNLSIGIDSKGLWGEVLDEKQNPELI